MLVRFVQRREIVPHTDIWEYHFEPERPVDFVPGQYVEVRLEGVAGDPRGGARTFSLTSLPSDTHITFITKHFALQSPYKQYLQTMQPGDPATIGDAMGDLVLPKSPAMPLVFVAGGIGMASYASMFKDLLARKEERPIFLFYALRAARERLFRELTDVYPLQLQNIVLAPNRLMAQEIYATTPPEALIYLSGSQRFVEGLRTDLKTLGAPHDHIVFDYYDGYTEL